MERKGAKSSNCDACRFGRWVSEHNDCCVYWKACTISNCARYVAVVVLGWSLLPSSTQASNPGVVVLRLLYSAMSGERTCEWVVSDSWIVASAIGAGSCANITCSCYRPRPSTSGWCNKCELMLLFDYRFYCSHRRRLSTHKTDCHSI